MNKFAISHFVFWQIIAALYFVRAWFLTEDKWGYFLYTLFVLYLVQLFALTLTLAKQLDERALRAELDRQRRGLHLSQEDEARGACARCKGLSIRDCIICHDNPVEMVFVACGHFCICQSCAVVNTCPICRKKSALQKVYQ